VRIGSRWQVREVALGDGYGSQGSLRLHFGLGGAMRVDELVVRWPRSGASQRFAGVPANRAVRVTEGAPGWEDVTVPPPPPRLRHGVPTEGG
jgi:hypothetical protein